MTAPKAPQQELFKAETAWFHIFKTMIDNGDVARMGPYAVTVYLVIKSHTNFATGRAFPALETIAEKSGVSLAQVKRELKTLEKYGYITTEKKGGRIITPCAKKSRSGTKRGGLLRLLRGTICPRQSRKLSRISKT